MTLQAMKLSPLVLVLALLATACLPTSPLQAAGPPPRPVKPKVFRGLEVVSVYPHYVGVMREGKFERVNSETMTAEERQAFGVLDPERAREHAAVWDRAIQLEADNAKAVAATVGTRREKTETQTQTVTVTAAMLALQQQQQPATAPSAGTAAPPRNETAQEYNDRLYQEKQRLAAEQAVRARAYEAEQEQLRLQREQQAADARTAATRAAQIQLEAKVSEAAAKKAAREKAREDAREEARKRALGQ
jgi:hypothetical protein